MLPNIPLLKVMKRSPMHHHRRPYSGMCNCFVFFIFVQQTHYFFSNRRADVTRRAPQHRCILRRDIALLRRQKSSPAAKAQRPRRRNICHLGVRGCHVSLTLVSSAATSLCMCSFPIHDHIGCITDVLNQPERPPELPGMHKEMISSDE